MPERLQNQCPTMLEEEQLLEEERLDRSKYREFSSRFVLSCFVNTVNLLELPNVQHQVTRMFCRQVA